MLHDYQHGATSEIRLEPNRADDLSYDELTANALAALEQLDAHENAGLSLLLRFGETLSKAKATIEHGKYNPWCRQVLKRSLSWCSSHRRLYEGRADLELALAWASATGHRWANCRSVERLLKIVTDWKKATQGDWTTAPAGRRKKRPVAHSELEEIAAALREILAEAEEAFETVRYELWLTAPPDGSAKEELVALGKRFRSRLRELGESCSALQVSKPIEAAADLPPIDYAVAGGALQ
jgi:hypothetical protein